MTDPGNPPMPPTWGDDVDEDNPPQSDGSPPTYPNGPSEAPDLSHNPVADILALVADVGRSAPQPDASPFVPLPWSQDDEVGDQRRLTSLSKGLAVPPDARPEHVTDKLARLIKGRLEAEKLTPPLRLTRCALTHVTTDDAPEPVEVVKVVLQKDAPPGIAPFVVGNEIDPEYVELLDLAGDLGGLADELVRGVRVGLLNEGELMQPGDVDWLGASGALHVQRATRGQL